jgi:asparagine synthase (glutamine-hydrolysing)
LKFGGVDVSARDIERQSSALVNRGPDRRRFWHEGCIGMGHLLMRVTNEDSLEAQPVHDGEAALTLVADARLDNREDLADALEIDAQHLRDLSDSELLLRAYRRWRADCVGHLIGDFAFAVWDGDRGELVLACDPMGQRVVFFHRGKDFFAFASEPKGLWTLPDVDRSLSEAGMAKAMFIGLKGGKHLTQYDEITLHEGIFRMRGGSLKTVTTAGDIAKRVYWTPKADPVHLDRDEAYYVETYRRVLSEAVACRLRRTVHPAALLLGGGFDSGAIAGLAGPVVKAQKQKLIAVSSVLPPSIPDRAGNARRWVGLLARDMPHLDVRYVTREGLDIFTGMTTRFVQTGTMHGSDAYALEAMMQTARAAGARVLLTGVGGDYTLNPRAPAWLVRLLLHGHVRTFMSELRAFRRHTGRPLLRIVWGELIFPLLPASLAGPFRRYRVGLRPFAPATPLSSGFVRGLCNVGIRPAAKGANNYLGDMQALRAHILRLHQRGSGGMRPAWHGLELTQPYHDKRVVELSLAIPSHLLMKNGRDRYLARTALKDIYPPEFQQRGSENDDLVPDYLEMVDRVRPRVLAEIDRMQRDGHLARYFDFDLIRAMLTGRNAQRKQPVALAIRSFLHACYVDWFQRDNRPEP